jgi:predicted esterase
MLELNTEFPFKARYFQTGKPDSSTKQVWFVLHGYGQLARYFIRNFEILTSHDICVIAPEGLSRFYLEDIEKRIASGNNRVGATWMTAEDRLTDISNYLNYLARVWEVSTKEIRNLPATVLGFSQGAATASRWMLNEPGLFDRLILWSGIFPPDLDFGKGHQVLTTKRVTLVYGMKDAYLNEKRMEEMESLTARLGIKPTIVSFDGGHEIDQPTLLQFI